MESQTLRRQSEKFWLNSDASWHEFEGFGMESRNLQRQSERSWVNFDGSWRCPERFSPRPAAVLPRIVAVIVFMGQAHEKAYAR